MRPLWKGSISFGLVHIPVKMYVATHDHDLKFVMLHKKDLSQVRYARMCKVEEKEIPWSEIVKGYEYSAGEYVIIEDEDLKKINLNKSKTIEILHFINEEEIDTIYYSKPYFLEPEKNAGKAYQLLLEAMNKSKKIGIAKFVIHNREHLAVIKPYENTIILNELRYDAELNNTKDLQIPNDIKSSPQDLSIAIKLIDHLTTPFKAKQYVDTYVEELTDMIEKKAKGKKIHPKGEKVQASKIHDITALLKASLEEPKQTPKKRKKTS
ncbi:MAG: Ku protein [Parachlamydiaceae bacterium]|nr:Ku protein [Parachlamydiaceae bacterium]